MSPKYAKNLYDTSNTLQLQIYKCMKNMNSLTWQNVLQTLHYIAIEWSPTHHTFLCPARLQYDFCHASHQEIESILLPPPLQS